MARPFQPDNSALLLIDHQVGTMQLIRNSALSDVKRNTLALAKAARILGLPIILTSSQEENLQGPLIPELAELLPESFSSRIRRAGVVNAWRDQEFLAAVRKTGRPNLILAGVTTDVCLVFPAIEAVADGFAVQAVMDASGSPFELSEQLARDRMRDAGVILTATNTVIAELAQDWSTPHGQQLLALLFSEVIPSPSTNG